MIHLSFISLLTVQSHLYILTLNSEMTQSNNYLTKHTPDAPFIFPPIYITYSLISAVFNGFCVVLIAGCQAKGYLLFSRLS